MSKGTMQMQSLGPIIVIVNRVDIQCLLHDLIFTSELETLM